MSSLASRHAMGSIWRDLSLTLKARTKTRGKHAFLLAQPKAFRLLDVGCGSEWPAVCKQLRPDCYYVGLDILGSTLSTASLEAADQYVLADPDQFSCAIKNVKILVDAVMSAHNLEHCHHPETVLRAMCRALQPGGMMYLAFPCKASIGFPSRQGTLNFFDDATHKHPPVLADVLRTLREEGLRIEFVAERYRPLVRAFIGAVLEPISAMRGRLAPLGATWAFYGFETVVWAKASGDSHKT